MRINTQYFINKFRVIWGFPLCRGEETQPYTSSCEADRGPVACSVMSPTFGAAIPLLSRTGSVAPGPALSACGYTSNTAVTEGNDPADNELSLPRLRPSPGAHLPPLLPSAHSANSLPSHPSLHAGSESGPWKLPLLFLIALQVWAAPAGVSQQILSWACP